MLALALALFCLPDQEHDRVIEGLRWLARHQAEDGSWGERCASCSCPVSIAALKAQRSAPHRPEIARRAKPLIESLADDSIECREKAEAELLELGESARAYLQDALDSRDPETRARALAILREIGAPGGSTNVEATALSLLCFIGAGYSHLSKDTFDGICFGNVVRKAAQWIMANQRPEGSFDSGGEEGNLLSALALSEIYSLTGSKRFKYHAQNAVDYVAVAAQEGALEGQTRAKWTTLLCSMVRYSASIAGFKQDGKAANQGVEWLAREKPQDAVFLAASRLAGSRHAGPNAQLASLARNLAAGYPETLSLFDGYVTTLALFRCDAPRGPLWKQWASKVKEALQKTVSRSECTRGSWTGKYGRITSTALGVLTFELYYRYANAFGTQ